VSDRPSQPISGLILAEALCQKNEVARLMWAEPCSFFLISLSFDKCTTFLYGSFVRFADNKLICFLEKMLEKHEQIIHNVLRVLIQ